LCSFPNDKPEALTIPLKPERGDKRISIFAHHRQAGNQGAIEELNLLLFG
jgi:hypothetical protein